MACAKQLSVSQAQELIEEIAWHKYGWLPQTELANLSKHALAAVRNNQMSKGADAIMLAKNLRLSQARFLLELIKAADLNEYSISQQNGTDPFIKFHFYRDRIIAECNDDGFTANDVHAICQIAPQNKKSNVECQSYIDEQGIGFRSVFKVASTAHIRSGPFSFYFEHEMDESKWDEPKHNGVGMVTPIWVSKTEEPTDPLTRITLNLLPGLDLKALFKQFDEIQDTLLLFLKKIKHISITIYQPDDSVSFQTSFTNQFNHALQEATLTKLLKVRTNPAKSTKKLYRVFTLHSANIKNDLVRNRNVADWMLAALDFDELLKDNLEGQLFKSLGVKQTSIARLRTAILSKHEGKSQAPNINLAESVSHLHYLFLADQALCPSAVGGSTGSKSLTETEKSLFWVSASNCQGTAKFPYELTNTAGLESPQNSPGVIRAIWCRKEQQSFFSKDLGAMNYTSKKEYDKEDEEVVDLPIFRKRYPQLWLFDQNGVLLPCVHGSHNIYIPSDNEFDTRNLINTTESRASNTPEKFPATFLHPAYFQAISKDVLFDRTNLELWLKDLGIYKFPRLTDSDINSLSEIMQYMAKNRGLDFLHILKAHWMTYSLFLTPNLTKKVSNLKLPCVGQGLKGLRFTYHPWLQAHSKYYLRNERFYFLDLNFFPGKENPIFPKEWSFLCTFGVKIHDNVDFFLALLRCIMNNSIITPVTDYKRVFDLYGQIQLKYLGSQDKKTDHKKIVNFFSKNCVIYVPEASSKVAIWKSTQHCLWDGPTYMKTQSTLAHLEDFGSNPLVKDLFCSTLKIHNTELCHLINEVESMSTSSSCRFNLADLLDLYRRIEAALLGPNSKDISTISGKFQSNKLIYVLPQKQWYSSEDCLWTDLVEVDGKANISFQYSSFNQLFLEFLGVKKANKEMLVQGLRKLIDRELESNSTIIFSKKFIREINNMNPVHEDLDGLLSFNILPVRLSSGKRSLMSSQDDFVIIDDPKLAEVFLGKVAFLDFDIYEVRKLQPFLAAMSLESRYISHAVKHNTCLNESSILLHEDLTSNLRRRSHALYRCANHYQSPRCSGGSKEIYDLLRGAKVFIVNDTVDCLTFIQDGKPLSIQSDKGIRFIYEMEGSLNIYVPKDPKDQEIFYLRALPKNLSLLFCSRNAKNEKPIVDMSLVMLVSDVLRCSDAALSDLLDGVGIIPASFADEYTEEVSAVTTPIAPAPSYGRPLQTQKLVSLNLSSNEIENISRYTDNLARDAEVQPTNRQSLIVPSATKAETIARFDELISDIEKRTGVSFPIPSTPFHAPSPPDCKSED